jgi:predicted permease
MRALLRRLGYLLRRSRHDADLRDEIEAHRSLRQSALEATGLSPVDASRASRRALGNVTLAREDARGVWFTTWLEDAWQDARIALRSFRRRPLLWTTAVLSLALGIGVNTAVFSAFEALILRRLPVPAPEELVNVISPGPRPGSRSTTGAGGVDAIFSYPLFRDMERFENVGFAGLAAYGDFSAQLSRRGDARIGRGLVVSGGYFPVLGVRPALGRLLTPADDHAAGAPPVVVLGHGYWTTTLGADPAILNDTLVVNGRALTVVGVAAAGFTGTALADRPPDVFVPLVMAETMRQSRMFNERGDHWLYAFGRLRPGVTREQAAQLINVPFGALIRDVEFPELRSGMGEPARTEFQARRILFEDGSRGQPADRAELRTIFLLLLAITGAVLLIACANVANMLLARAADRATETAVRLSIGASPGRLVRWLLAESCLLGLAGGLGALVVAALTVEALLAFAPADNRPFEFAVNAPVGVFALALGVGTGLLFGMFPAIQGVRSAVAAGLHAQSSRTSGSRAAGRFRTTLATTQVALATALLAVAGLAIVSLANVARAELGIRREGLAVFGVSPHLAGYSAERARALVDRLEESLAGLPGVTSVSASTVQILSNSRWRQNLTVEGYQAPAGSDTNANRASVSAGYFRTLGIPLVAGREFTQADAGASATVAIVNEAFARKFQLASPVVGKRFGFGQGDDVGLDIEIVGVVRDAKYSNVREPPPPQFFLSYRQADNGASPTYFYVRSTTDAAALLDPIRSAVVAVDRNLPISNLQTMENHIWVETRMHRLIAGLSSAFALLATVLAAVGLYAVVAYVVARRWREFGIRLALGATSADIRWSIFRHVGVIVAVGAVVGAGASFALGRLGQSMLFGLEGSEPYVVAGAVGTVFIVAVCAAALPAGRAASVRPTEALRAE